MCVGSSPVTSEMTSASTRAFVAAASRPPWIAERCLLTVFMSWIGAPQRSNSFVVALSSLMLMPSSGTESRADPPPDTSASRRSSGPSVFARRRISRAAFSPLSSGTGWPASITLIRFVSSPWRYRVITRPSSGAAAGQRCSTASAIAAAAFPAPSTRVRPAGGDGRCAGRISSGSAAATAARNDSTSSSLGVMGRARPRWQRALELHHPHRALEQRARRIGELLEDREVVVVRAADVLREHLLPVLAERLVLVDERGQFLPAGREVERRAGRGRIGHRAHLPGLRRLEPDVAVDRGDVRDVAQIVHADDSVAPAIDCLQTVRSGRRPWVH